MAAQPSIEKLRELLEAAPKEHPPVRYRVIVRTEPKFLSARSGVVRWVRATSERRAAIAGMLVNREVFGEKAYSALADENPPGQVDRLRETSPWLFPEGALHD